ncbi:cobaltochelatase CobN subunit [Melghirimyces profundicolus]|uniref:Cobaltochelatase CobN subunit n=1 Tax=Melghirimyces profundicolus TaxID=1242148 RepID=A0A2T6C8C8_9BACL|nr:cobaltochelatase subunit CobN [Melghirimyces profundicolus]PTX64565.1 cobaltochelatase CobN subunit [Melghirimyces profundicolus]
MILYLTTADTDILTLREAYAELPDGFPTIRTANVTDWADREEEAREFLDRRLPVARVVILRLLGGKKAHPPSFERVVRHCREKEIPLMAWPGDQEPYPELQEATNVAPSLSSQAMLYAVYGGVRNFVQLFRMISDTWLGTAYGYEEPRDLPWSGIYRPGSLEPLDRQEWEKNIQPEEAAAVEGESPPVVGILFYRAHWMSGNTDFIDSLMESLRRRGCVPLPVLTQSLKAGPDDGVQQKDSAWPLLTDPSGRPAVDALIVTMSFSVHRRSPDDAGEGEERSWIDGLDVPVLQAIVSLHERKRWDESDAGLTPLDTAMNVAMPEFDGRIITVPFSFKETVREDPLLGIPLRRYVAAGDRTDFLARLAARWARLRRKPAGEKRLAFLLTNAPSKNSRIGNAVGLDTPASMVRILHALKEQGYHVGNPEDLPRDGDELALRLIERCSNDRGYLTGEQLAGAEGHLTKEDYRKRWEQISQKARRGIEDTWGPPPGDVFLHLDRLVIPGIRFGHIFVGLQPPRGFGDNPIAIYHSPDLVPTHHYTAYYHWLRESFGADAVVHVGKHGTLEWLPGKGTGLSVSCYPEVVLDDLPHFYPYIINNPGEGTQAKRRSHATIVDHLVPVLTQADTYDELDKLEQLMDEHAQMQPLDPKKLPLIEKEIWDTVVQARLDRDLNRDEYPEDFEAFMEEIDGYICELKSAQIRDGLHVMGRLPETEEAWTDLLYSLLQLPTGSVPSLPEAVCRDLGLDWDGLQNDLGKRWPGSLPVADPWFGGVRTVGDVREEVIRLSKAALAEKVIRPAGVVPGNPGSTAEGGSETDALLPAQEGRTESVLGYARDRLLPKLLETPAEIGNLLHELEGGLVPAGPSGSPTRGMPDILPTGRNFYSVDPHSLPSPGAWEVGRQLAEELIRRYREEEGEPPRTVGLVMWGTSAMRTRGDDIAQVLALLGVRPVWRDESRRVVDLEVIPLEELGRPRVDVTVRISGFFRDAFPNLVRMINRAVEMVNGLDERAEDNPLAARVAEETEEKVASGLSREEARETSLYRVFGSKPGTYGAGMLPLIESRQWRDDRDLARVYTTWSGYAYTEKEYGKPAAAEFENRLRRVQVATKNQDNREHDIFDSDDYFQEHGGMVATVRSLTGKDPKTYFGDSSNPRLIRVRHLKEEALRVFRSRVINPKWMRSVRRHGYKGALEMANTVDFLFGYDATARIIDDWMYEQLSRRYALDPEVRQFFARSNPWALKDIAERLLEAAQRGMWKEPDPETTEALAKTLLEAESRIEGFGGERRGEDA